MTYISTNNIGLFLGYAGLARGYRGLCFADVYSCLAAAVNPTFWNVPLGLLFLSFKWHRWNTKHHIHAHSHSLQLPHCLTFTHTHALSRARCLSEALWHLANTDSLIPPLLRRSLPRFFNLFPLFTPSASPFLPPHHISNACVLVYIYYSNGLDRYYSFQ